jgi:hypothetical protein
MAVKLGNRIMARAVFSMLAMATAVYFCCPLGIFNGDRITNPLR